MSLIFATQLTAVATAALAVFAIFTTVFAVLAFRKQAQEVGILVEESKREADERRRAQAARVFTGPPRDPVHLTSPGAKNASDLPIYGAQFWYSDLDGLSGPDDLGMILPGEIAGGSHKLSVHGSTHAILAFRDAAGVRWTRMTDGTLAEPACDTARDSILAQLGETSQAGQARENTPGG